ncbi:uncharacterized protein LOC123293372 [Chrysoperla carnea]|uniref:uncharacterized protein LOC123293372 n=1 Tax=Chrysoperla carnea TaxID=189513 RepID=UPI001D08A07F|nr:uncharacterized protein LOC123293372 [Chrysoperla carnea]XP_044730101.1 uncharacterized protein LOC123293372 [Chrysoperla carnea]XP_044730102.1 uncharacterized protein LOC123293372 [Chrysoperla carnea]XP_044730103.1 uncharacterized protein LOC123293372 [Chrysoperla carnea]
MNWRVSSCCCFSLRTGTLLLGYFGVISGIIASLGILFSLPFIKDWVLEVEKENKLLTPEDLEALVKYVQIILIIVLVLCVLSVLFNFLLLIGVYQEKPKIIKICVIVSIISCVIILLGAVVYLIGSFINPQLMGSFVIELVALALQVYFTMVFHSYYLEVIESVCSKRDGSNMPREL